MNRVNKFLKKNTHTLIGIVAIAFVNWIIDKPLDWLWARYSVNVTSFLKSKVEFPVFGLLLSVSIVLIFNRYFERWTISRRKLKIIKATYGANDVSFDITTELNKAVIDSKLKIVVSNAIAGDPLPGVPKVASVHYEFNGRRDNKNIKEGNILELP